MSDLGVTEPSSGKLLLTGWASVFGVFYDVRDSVGVFEERIERGAFARSLNTTPPPNVVLLENHAGALLARTRSPNPDKPPNLRLSEKDRGLYVEADLDASLERVKDLRSQIEHSGIEWSLSFQINADTWSEDFSKRYVKDVSQNNCDITVCPFGANQATAGATIEPRELTSTVQQRSAYAESLRGSKERRMCETSFQVPVLDRPRSKSALDAPLFDIDAELARISELRTRKPGWGSRATVENDLVECQLCEGTGKILEGNRKCPDCLGRGKVKKGRSKDWDAVSRREMAELQALKG